MAMPLSREAPDAPGGLPLLGHSLSLLRRDRLGYVTGLRAVGDACWVRFGARRFLVLNAPELVHAVLVEQGRHFDRGRIFDKARPYVGEGLYTAEGAEHHRQRRMVQPAFGSAEVGRYTAVIHDVTREQIAAWPTHGTVNIERAMHDLHSEIIGRTMFRAPQARQVVQAARDELPTLVRGLGVRTLMPDAFARVPVPVNRRYDAACARVRGACDRLVAAHREIHGDLGDFVSMLVRARDARTGVTMSDTEIRDHVMTLLISAIETPATVLAWALYEVARNPELRDGLEREVAEVLGAQGRVIEVDDLPRLRLTDAVVHEALRLHHPLWMLMRRAVRPVTVGGVDIPAGGEVIYSPAAMHRDPTVFPDPLRFDPRRWLDGAATPAMRRAFVPFSLGNRQCLGDRFAWNQMKTTLAAIVGGCRLALPDGFRARTVVSSIVHLERLPMVVQPRKPW
ncbi:cytochrome P450 [Micromonospora sp. WMMD712]|uniref:cytochrome P450 n=1 Tax=Micromonospora sp. WMMD712 TaxID=3016096 RepID=UPI00249AF708|nr:cytochrome P450 [Micromonospora sp. WMMD712]WFE58553.1 cytochrome P450 [Micromonospora sp. WMMD712]